jgi:hypothetical protein
MIASFYFQDKIDVSIPVLYLSFLFVKPTLVLPFLEHRNFCLQYKSCSLILSDATVQLKVIVLPRALCQIKSL